jgi:tetratricopeptide (TPR) repeat protein
MIGGPAAAVASIEALGLDLRDPANEPALRVFASDLVAMDRADRAIASVDRALSSRPDSASLHALMGTTLARAYRSVDARSAFKRALAIDPDQPEALGGMAALAGAAGDTERAVELFDRAAAFDPSNSVYAYAAAQLLLAAGNRDAAKARLEAIVRQSAAHVGARNDLAWLLASEAGDLDLALALAREASRLGPEPATLDTLGFVHLARGEYERAAEALERAIAMPGSSPSAHYHLALALNRSGDTARARELLQRALAAGDFPEAEAARGLLANLDPP